MSVKVDIEPWTLVKNVYPQHTDHAGVMWHGSYIGWLEEARIEALSKVGLEYVEISSEGIDIAVVALEIHYLKPLKHGEEVCIKSWPLARKGIRWPWHTIFVKNGNIIAAEANVDLVVVSKVGGNIRVLRELPEKLKIAFCHLERGA